MGCCNNSLFDTYENLKRRGESTRKIQFSYQILFRSLFLLYG
jgi:hypothetical protein